MPKPSVRERETYPWIDRISNDLNPSFECSHLQQTEISFDDVVKIHRLVGPFIVFFNACISIGNEINLQWFVLFVNALPGVAHLENRILTAAIVRVYAVREQQTPNRGASECPKVVVGWQSVRRWFWVSKGRKVLVETNLCVFFCRTPSTIHATFFFHWFLNCRCFRCVCYSAAS